jgi:hypothetical protein
MGVATSTAGGFRICRSQPFSSGITIPERWRMPFPLLWRLYGLGASRPEAVPAGPANEEMHLLKAAPAYALRAIGSLRAAFTGDFQCSADQGGVDASACRCGYGSRLGRMPWR